MSEGKVVIGYYRLSMEDDSQRERVTVSSISENW